jgi:NAD(P)-dependent dehydrogenase (short-subunit alcohol dehydrogenase family)
MSGRFAGRGVLITGAAGGLGAAAAAAFAAEGARLTLVDRDGDGLARLAAAHGGRAVPGDAADAALAAAAVAAAGPLDVLVLAAGIDPLAATTVDATAPADWDAVMAVNLRSAFLFARAALPALRARGGGAIVAIASVGGVRPLAAEAAYAVSKAGLVQLMRCIALDHAGEGIRANSVCPGILEGVMRDRAAAMTAEAVAGRHARAARAVPLGREGRYGEIAGAVLWLADGAASGYVTGTELLIDGGLALT